MFHAKAIPYLKDLSDGVIVSRSLRLFGIGESAVEAQLREDMNAMTNPTLAPYAKEGEVELRLTAKAASDQDAQALIAPAEAALRERFGELIYGADVPSLEAVCLSLLQEKNRTLGAAESCTGGLFAKRLTDLPGASTVFRGGVVSYTDEVKHGILGVSQSLLDKFGAVSAPVAQAMAESARRVLDCDMAVSFTGLAGPDGDDRGNPVGLIYVGLAWDGGAHVRTVHAAGPRERVRTVAASHGFDLLRRKLEGLRLS